MAEKEALFMFYYDVEGKVRVHPLPYGFAKILNIYPSSAVKDFSDAFKELGFMSENAE